MSQLGASHYNPDSINVGDYVRIKPYTTTPMSGGSYRGSGSDLEGWVTQSRTKYKDWGPVEATVRTQTAERHCDYMRPADTLELLKRGDGTVTPGVTWPFTKTEIWWQKRDAFFAKLYAVDNRFEGFCNPATYLAYLYLVNERRAYEMLKGMWRKDGSVNPNKVKKLFQLCKLRVDDWAFEPKIDIPAEYKKLCDLRKGLDINWAEVAANLEQRS